MTKEYRIGGFFVEMDEKVARGWHDRAEELDCDCRNCRNSIVPARTAQVSRIALALLDSFGAAR